MVFVARTLNKLNKSIKALEHDFVVLRLFSSEITRKQLNNDRNEVVVVIVLSLLTHVVLELRIVALSEKLKKS